MTKSKKANGGHARAKNLSPARRKAIAAKAAKARWDNPDAKAKKKSVQRRSAIEVTTDAQIDAVVRQAYRRADLRDEIAQSVLTGLYSNIDIAQKFAAHVMGPDMLLPEAFTRIAYSQADEALRLRSL